MLIAAATAAIAAHHLQHLVNKQIDIILSIIFYDNVLNYFLSYSFLHNQYHLKYNFSKHSMNEQFFGSYCFPED